MHFTKDNVIEYSVVPVIAAGDSVDPNDEAETNNNNNGEDNQ